MAITMTASVAAVAAVAVAAVGDGGRGRGRRIALAPFRLVVNRSPLRRPLSARAEGAVTLSGDVGPGGHPC